jgi:tRNA splicing endonuclease
MKNSNIGGLTTLTMDKEKEELSLYMHRLEGIKNYKDLPEMDRNPFICLVPDEINDAWKKVQSGSNIIPAIDGDGGMITLKDQRVFYRPVHVDKGTYTKVFRRNLREMFKLTYGSLKLFGYIMDNMNFLKNPDLVYISMEEAMEWCDYGENSRSVVYRSLVELCVKGYICKTGKPWLFYVNPAHAFNGNRVTLVTDYFLKDDESLPAQLSDYKSEEKKTDEDLTERLNDFE